MHSNWKFPPRYYDQSLGILETSLRQVAAYRAWQAYDPGPEYPVDLRYAAMPALTKSNIRDNFPDGLVPIGRDVKQALDSGKIGTAKTGGSSDISVTNVWNQEWWDASEKASWKLNSHAAQLATGNHAEAILANPRNVGRVSDDVDLPMENRRLSRFLFLNEKTNPAKWSPRLMDRMIAELATFRPVVLEANPSLLAKLCRYAAERGKEVFKPGLIVFTYEYPTRLHHRQIRRVLDVPMASSYGSTETGYVFMQCEEGRFHQNTEFCRVDFQPLKPEHGGPFVGRILVTTFNNPWYYMLRFDVKDLVRLHEEGKCPCGRNSGIIVRAIEGRTISATMTCEGRLVTLRELDEAMSLLDGIDEYRLDQLSGKVYNLHLVTRRSDKDNLTREATGVLRVVYGKEAQVSVVYEEALYPEDSGKYSVASALFPIDIEKYLDTSTMLKDDKR